MIVALLFLGLVNGYEKCKTGFKLVGNSCRDINECRGNHGCGLRQKCKNVVGSYECKCDKGFSRDGVSTKNIAEPGDCYDIDECTTGIHLCGSENSLSETVYGVAIPKAQGICKNTLGSYTCIPGKLKKSKKEDFVCAKGNHNCDKHADCMQYDNTQSSFWCKCRKGLVGWGSKGQCADIDECEAMVS
jgi:fibulin 1/2